MYDRSCYVGYLTLKKNSILILILFLKNKGAGIQCLTIPLRKITPFLNMHTIMFHTLGAKTSAILFYLSTIMFCCPPFCFCCVYLRVPGSMKYLLIKVETVHPDFILLAFSSRAYLQK